MGLFGDKDANHRSCIRVGGAFDDDRETDKAAVFGVAIEQVLGQENSGHLKIH